MAEGDFTGGSTDTAVVADVRSESGAKADQLDIVVTIGAQAGAKSTATAVTASRAAVGANTWAGDSTSVDVTQTPTGAGVVDLTGALAYATDVAGTTPSTAALVTTLAQYVDAVKAAGAAIRLNGGDRIQAGLTDENGDPIAENNGWVGRPLDIYRTDVFHGDEGVYGFVLAGVDYVAWPYEALLPTDFTPHPGISVGG